MLPNTPENTIFSHDRAFLHYSPAIRDLLDEEISDS